ncbi:MAG: lysophospholipid acyltransferase family protein [Planctomycetota bacterium]
MSWIEDLQNRQPGRAFWRIAIWQAMQTLCFYVIWLVYRYRSWGVRHIPATGPVLFAANHQSFFDPMLIGSAASKRHFFALGRSTLYDHWFLGNLAEVTNSIPVEQGAGDVKAIKRCIEVLKARQALLIFPEGARTLDGQVQPFETGTMLIIKRAKPMVVPVALEGVADAWKRGHKLPRLWGPKLGVKFGPPIPAETLTAMSPQDAMTYLRNRVETMRQAVEHQLNTL